MQLNKLSANNTLNVGLVGNPNVGKTTLFNALTGARQKVGNWPGVTVEKKSGFFHAHETQVEVVDLPGIYSLITSAESSLDERIACEFILAQQADVIINIVDASNLERNLYLTLQLIEMQVPVIIALNMLDVVRQRGGKILLDIFAQELGCRVIPLDAKKSKSMQQLKQAIIEMPPPTDKKISYPPLIQQAITQIIPHLSTTAPPEWLAMRLLENDIFAQKQVTPAILAEVKIQQQKIQQTLQEDADILLADARYSCIQTLVPKFLQKIATRKTAWTTHLDAILLNRYLGFPIFFAVMYAMFFFAINIGGALQDFFALSSNTLFVEGTAYGLQQLHAPTGLIALFANGIGKGISTTLTFVPVLGAMFLFLALLEDSGYMARAAFVVDRLMRALGLPGKAFVPMIVGFGCNVPAVMAARTLENQRDRILTVMMSPFMSCGARLAIYAVFVAAFFPQGGQNIIFMLYLIGMLMALVTGYLLRKTLLQGQPAPLIMELPPYRWPKLKTLFLHAWQRLKGFVLRAGKLIVPICMVLGVLNTLNLDGSLNNGLNNAHSLLATLGHALTPIFAPMGIQAENWPATVGLMTGVLAKEVVVGTLNTLYSQVDQLAVLQANTWQIGEGLRAALLSIPQNLSHLSESLLNPVLAKAPIQTLTQDVYGEMYQRFDGGRGAIAYLLFVLLYFPCVSTLAAMVREIHRSWAVFSMLWTTSLAYCVAVGFYQVTTFILHPLSSLLWLTSICVFLLLIFFGIRLYMLLRLQDTKLIGGFVK